MLLKDWISIWVSRPRVRRWSVSTTHVPSAARTSNTLDADRPATYPARRPGLGSLPALIHRYAAQLDSARRLTAVGTRIWSDVEIDVHRTLTECAPAIFVSQGDETIHIPSETRISWSASIDLAASALSAGAWAVGQEYRATHPTDAGRWGMWAEGPDGSIPTEARKAIEPAIRFAYWLYRALREADPAGSTIDRADHEKQARSMYRTLASAAYACCRAGLAFDDLSLGATPAVTRAQSSIPLTGAASASRHDRRTLVE